MNRAAMMIAALSVASIAAPVSAQDQAAPALLLQLNAAQPSDKGCRLTFVVGNTLGQDIDRAAFEIALFNEAGVVDRLTVLDFSELPNGKTKVARFDLAGVDCGKISRILVNAATECTGPGVAPKTCLGALKPESKSGIQFGV